MEWQIPVNKPTSRVPLGVGSWSYTSLEVSSLSLPQAWLLLAVLVPSSLGSQLPSRPQSFPPPISPGHDDIHYGRLVSLYTPCHLGTQPAPLITATPIECIHSLLGYHLRKPRHGENKAPRPSHIDRDPSCLLTSGTRTPHFLPIRDHVLMNHHLKHPWVPRPASVE